MYPPPKYAPPPVFREGVSKTDNLAPKRSNAATPSTDKAPKRRKVSIDKTFASPILIFFHKGLRNSPYSLNKPLLRNRSNLKTVRRRNLC